jgi:glycine dehydrogenase subunit 2
LPIAAQRDDGTFTMDSDRPKSIGRVHSYYGNFANAVRGFTYILSHGGDGLEQVSRAAVLNANYLKARLEETFCCTHNRIAMHETVVTGERQAEKGVRTLDMVKRLMDYGFHPPTIYFPLTVPEAMLIEPTETESRASLDAFADALLAVAAEAESDPEIVLQAPHSTPVTRLDEATAARRPKLTWSQDPGSK